MLTPAVGRGWWIHLGRSRSWAPDLGRRSWPAPWPWLPRGCRADQTDLHKYRCLGCLGFSCYVPPSN
jgi:hypothetical protein